VSKNIEMKDVKIKERVVLREYDPVKFTQKLQELFLDGCEVDTSVMPRYKTMMMEVTLTRELSLEDVKGGGAYSQQTLPNVIASVEPKSVQLPKEALDDLSWDALKALVSIRGITGRDRNKITNEFIATYC
jgi:hypothetical protein